MAEELSSKRVGELKAILKEMNVSSSGCIEKKDLIERILKARTDLEEKKKNIPLKKRYQEKINGFDVYAIQTDPKPELLVFVFHGFGANAANLADIGDAVIQQGKVGSKKIRIVTVEAPIELGPESYAWWPLDLQELFQKMMITGVEGLFKGSKPKEMDSTVAAVRKLIDSEAKRFGLPLSKVIYCGFSQGSWLATQLALTAKEMPSALVAFSSALYCDEWKEKAVEKKGLKVLQFHGKADFVLPFQQGQMLKDCLEKAGCTVDFNSFQGAHTIPEEGVMKLDELLVSLF